MRENPGRTYLPWPGLLPESAPVKRFLQFFPKALTLFSHANEVPSVSRQAGVLKPLNSSFQIDSLPFSHAEIFSFRCTMICIHQRHTWIEGGIPCHDPALHGPAFPET